MHHHHNPTFCVEHEPQLITHFCCSSKCLLPMCSFCIPVHEQEHKEFETEMQMEKMRKVIDEVSAEVEKRMREVGDGRAVLREIRGRVGEKAKIVAENARAVLIEQVENIVRSIEKSLREHPLLQCLTNKLLILQSELSLTQRQLDSRKQCKGVILFKQRGRNDLDEVLSQISNLISQPIHFPFRVQNLKIHLQNPHNPNNQPTLSQQLKSINKEAIILAERVRY